MAASSQTVQSTKDIFKRNYGKINDLRMSGDPLDEIFKFSSGQKVGDSFVEAAILEDDVGVSWLGSDQGILDLEPPVAGSIKQARIIPSQTALSSAIAWGYVTRSAGGDAVSFANGANLLFKTHLESHNKLNRVGKIYGQSSSLLGYVSYAASGTIYRGATYSGSGTVTLTRKDGTTIAFTNGLCVVGASLPAGAQSAVVMAPGNFAAGHYVAKKGIKLSEVDYLGAVTKSGRLVSVDANLGILYLDFVATAPSATSGSGSQRICYSGWEASKVMVGAKKILENTGTLFEISAAQYSLWSGNVKNLGNKAFDLKAVQEAVADAINAGGLDKPLSICVNPRTFGNMSTNEASFRKYDASYKSASANNGFEAIEYYAANGANKIYASPIIMEGDAFGFVEEDWICSGSQMPSFRILGMGEDDVVFPLQNQTGFGVRSYGDEFVFCRKPAKQILWTGINDEGVQY